MRIEMRRFVRCAGAKVWVVMTLDAPGRLFLRLDPMPKVSNRKWLKRGRTSMGDLCKAMLHYFLFLKTVSAENQTCSKFTSVNVYLSTINMFLVRSESFSKNSHFPKKGNHIAECAWSEIVLISRTNAFEIKMLKTIYTSAFYKLYIWLPFLLDVRRRRILIH